MAVAGRNPKAEGLEILAEAFATEWDYTLNDGRMTVDLYAYDRPWPSNDPLHPDPLRP